MRGSYRRHVRRRVARAGRGIALVVVAVLAAVAVAGPGGLPASSALLQGPGGAPEQAPAWTSPDGGLRLAARAGTIHSEGRTGVFNGVTVRYRAALEETLVDLPSGDPGARIFAFSYVAQDIAEPDERPVVFLFNGGPGAASNMLHFGAFGPRRVEHFDTAAMGDPELPLVDNPDTILDVADLVFIDPSETGFSRLEPGVPDTTFRSIDGDAYAVGQVILHWLAHHGRLRSPVHIGGESYGTLRAVALARDLAGSDPAIRLEGLVMISQAIRYNGPVPQGVRGLPDPLRSFARLEDVAALGWYHDLLEDRDQTLGDAIAAARRFARTDYAAAMLQGSRLPAGERRRIARELERLTGLSAQHWLENDLHTGNVRRSLLADRGLALAQFDGRETEPLAEIPDDAERDWDAYVLGITAHAERLARSLGMEYGERYVSIVPDPYGFEETWQYIRAPGDGLDVQLAKHLAAHPGLRVMVPMGVYDTTSSTGGTRHMFAQMPTARGQVQVALYPGGHMPYVTRADVAALAQDVRAFVQGGEVASDRLDIRR